MDWKKSSIKRKTGEKAVTVLLDFDSISVSYMSYSIIK